MDDRKIGYPILLILIAVLAGTWIYVACILSRSPMYRVIRFERIGNLRIDDPVKIQGVTKGEVDAIAPVDGSVAVKVRAYEPFEVYRGYLIRNVDRGLMGDRAITIEPGNPSLPAVPVGDTLHGEFRPGISEWVGQAWRLEKVVDSLTLLSGRLLTGTDERPSFPEQFGAVVASAETLTARLLRLSRIAHHDLGRQLDTLDHFVGATGRLVETVAAAGPEYIDNIHAGFTRIEEFVGKLEETLRGLTALVAKLEDEECPLWSNRLAELATNIKELRVLIRDICDGAARLKLQISRWRE